MSGRLARIQQLEMEARDHKAKVRFHRSRLRACMDELSKLRAACAALGIQFNGVEETHGQPERAQHKS